MEEKLCPACNHEIWRHPKEKQRDWPASHRTSCGLLTPQGTCGCRVYQEEIRFQ